jgi:alkanesulfonate monooxygenase SsuD/methylene tetrahydromethanopterin reductase-like flavin-dependent oxidoreductase (luciferase family)
VVSALLRGETVEHVGEFEAHGALSWCPGELPIAIAGRGPRVERFAAECADWILLAGRPVDAVAGVVARLRSLGQDRRGRAAAIAWNPSIAWDDAMRRDVREHLAYMVVDMPPAERAELGVDNALAADLRETFAANGAQATGCLIPDAVVLHYAVVVDRGQVVERLSALRQEVAPELFVFDANDYSVAFLEDLAEIAAAAGIQRSA